MKKVNLLLWLVLLNCLFLVLPAMASDPLVIKTDQGKFIPAAANEWIKAGEHSFRFLLKSGLKAPDVASQLEAKLPKIAITATDDLTLLFKGEGLTEHDLLEKLSGLPIEKSDETESAMAALVALGGDSGPALSDLSSAGSIRASKKFELPSTEQRKNHPENLVGKLVRLTTCSPMPTLTLRIINSPTAGTHQSHFKAGTWVKVRGYFQVDQTTGQIDTEEERTKINLRSSELKWGNKVFGRPIGQEGDVWILETIELLP